jgi:RNA polymerase sigma factor (sigma-70 family)
VLRHIYACLTRRPTRAGPAPARMTELHRQIDGLPAEEREVFDLLWYQELPQAEAAALLGVSVPTIKRRWLSARRRLHKLLGEE